MVAKLCNEVFKELDQTSNAIIEKKIDFEPGKYFTIANQSELYQVFLNLTTNAIQAIEEKKSKTNNYKCKTNNNIK